MKPVLEVRDVTRHYQLEGSELQVLQPTSLKIEQGEMIAIIGPSGSGKSTLMHIVGLLDRPSSGSVVIDGQDTATLSENELSSLRNKRIGFVFQAFNLLAKTSALTNVELPMVYGGVPAGERKRRAKAALERVGLGHRLQNSPAQLSGGQQQRVAIARALVNEPSIVLGDEPTGNLDSKSGIDVMTMLQELHAQGITVVLVTHDDRIAQHAQRVVRIADGRIVSDERVKDRIFASEAMAVPDDARELMEEVAL